MGPGTEPRGSGSVAGPFYIDPSLQHPAFVLTPLVCASNPGSLSALFLNSRCLNISKDADLIRPVLLHGLEGPHDVLHLSIWLCHAKLGAGYAAGPSHSCKDYSGPVLTCCGPKFSSPPAHRPEMPKYSFFMEDAALCASVILLPPPLLTPPCLCREKLLLYPSYVTSSL